MLRQIFCAPQNFFHFEPATMTMKLLVVASAIASAAAFAPAGGSQKVSTALDATRAVAAAKPKPKAKPVRATKAIKKGEFAYGLPGSLPPVENFDPLGFSTKADEETVKRYRECEIMHGRFAQMAFLGFVVPEKIAQGANWGDDYLAPGGTALDVFESNGPLVLLTLALISGLEVVRLLETQPGTRTDAKVESIGWRPENPEEFARMQVRELQNGRLAMLAVAGEIAQELVNGEPLLVNLQNSGFVSF